MGNTFGDKDAFATLLDEVSTKVFDRLPDETWFYPGHGNDSVLGNERPHLAEWRERGWWTCPRRMPSRRGGRTLEA